jgi:hypothetical protein
MAGRLGRQTWPADMSGRLGRQTWPSDLAVRLGRQTWPADLIRKGSLANVDCSGERLTCVPKSSGFWNTFSYNIRIKTCKIHWGIPCRCPTIRGASWNVTSLYHYIKPKCVSKSSTFWDASQSFSRAIYIKDKACRKLSWIDRADC